MSRKILLMAGILVIWMASPAAAQYGPRGTIEATQSTVVAGTSVTISGQGCAADEPVNLSVSPLGQSAGAPVVSTTADGSGAFTANVPIPAGTATGYTITSQCGDLVLATSVSVAQPGGNGTGPNGTGSNSGGGSSSGGGSGAGGTDLNSSNATGSGLSSSGSGSSGTSTGSLARTGTDNFGPLVTVGSILVAAGGMLVLTTRRHRNRGTAAS